ncbi:MAG: sulfate permease [Myxococcales bacterium]|nr:sulfate permease [Myxococcales bacterium]
MPSALSRHIPLLEQLRTRQPGDLQSDVMAGLTTAIMLVPQGMAYAMLAGLDPIVGLYASTVPLMIYGALGTSRQLAVGPVAMVSLLVASAVAPLANGDAAVYLALAGLLALLVGAIQWGMGVLRLGFLVKFMSHPVIAGFTSAAALIIGLSQLSHVLGVKIPRSHHVHEILLHAIEKAGDTNLVTLGISLASMATLVALKRFAPRFPRFLLVVAGGALAVWGLGLHEMGVSIVGDVPSGLPSPALPALELGSIQALLPTAITIALVGFMESISVAKAFARSGRYSIDADKELQALGLANVAGSFLGAYPVTGGFSRTAVNAQAGARTGLAGIVTAGVVVLTLLFLTPLFTFLPKAVLAAIIMTAVFGLIDFAEAKHLWHVSRPDLAAMGVTFVATLALGIEQGILIGVVGSLLWFVWSTSRPHVAVLGRLPGTSIYRNVERYPEAEQLEHAVALRIDAPLFFANTAFLETTVRDHLTPATRHVVVDCKAIGSVDAQALTTIDDILTDLEDRGVTVWLAGVRGPVRDALHAAHIWERIGEDHIVERVAEAMDEVEKDGRPRLVS